jgi:hypothetical protein
MLPDVRWVGFHPPLIFEVDSFSCYRRTVLLTTLFGRLVTMTVSNIWGSGVASRPLPETKDVKILWKEWSDVKKQWKGLVSQQC